MAYVELRDNSLPPLPKLPVVHNGRWVVYGSQGDRDDGNAVVQSQQ